MVALLDMAAVAGTTARAALNYPEILGVPTGVITSAGIWTLVATVSGIAGVWLKNRAPMRRAQDEGEINSTLIFANRLRDVEDEMRAERKACDAQLREMRDRIDAMQATINGLIRQLLQFQTTTGQAMPMSLRSPAIDRALDTLSEQLKDDPA